MKLSEYDQRFDELIQKIRINISNFGKKHNLEEWIREAYFYAEKSRSIAISIRLNKANEDSLRELKKQNKTRFTTRVDFQDIFDLYSKRRQSLKNYSERVKALHGVATPIIYGGGLLWQKRGHTKEQHVFQYVNDLHERLKRKKKKVVSGFLSEESANSFVARTIEANKDKIQEWLENPTEEGVPFSYDFEKEAAGLILCKGNNVALSGSIVIIVLVYDPEIYPYYWLKTSYIET